VRFDHECDRFDAGENMDRQDDQDGENPPSQASKGPNRRGFLRTAGLAGAGAAALGSANQVIKDHPALPVILTTHEIAGSFYDDNVYPYQAGDPDNDAGLSSYGQQVWDTLVKDNDQVFLTLNGHYWPPGRVTMQNSAGHDVQVHITNYQNRYYGGAARFSGFAPVPARPGRPAKQMLVAGTLAYWRFDDGGANGTAFTSAQTITDSSGHGNDLTTLVTVSGSASAALTWSNEYHPDQPGHGSLYFNGGQNPLHGAYLTTAASAR
jgi:hypothetical protein